MYRLKPIYSSLFVIFSSFHLLSCQKDENPLPANIETTVTGKVFDEVNNIPVSNTIINIGEYIGKANAEGFLKINFVQWVGSTQTDQNGNYQIKFKTSGKGSRYRVVPEKGNVLWSKIEYYDIGNIGKSFTCDMNLLHLYPVDLKITLDNIDWLPVTPSMNSYMFGLLDDININNTEVTRTIYVNKNSQQTLVSFWRVKTNGKQQVAKKYIPGTNIAGPTEYVIVLKNEDFVDLLP